MEATTIVGFLIQAVVLTAGVVWKLARMEASLRETIGKERAEINIQITAVNAKFDMRLAEVLAKINAVELKSLEIFLRRDSFREVYQQLAGHIAGIDASLKERLTRMEEKLDNIPTR